MSRWAGLMPDGLKNLISCQRPYIVDMGSEGRTHIGSQDPVAEWWMEGGNCAIYYDYKLYF